MRLAANRIAAFLRDPGPCRVVLLFGDDGGLVHERGDGLVRLVAERIDDPFRVSELERDGVSRIVEEAVSRPLTGGRRVVRVRDVTDVAAPSVQTLLASKAEALVVLEAGELPTRSKLRTVVEGAPDGVAIGCYGEQGAELASTIGAVLAERGVQMDDEARAYLCDHLGTDRGSTRRELEKLATYIHPATRVTLDAAVAMVGDMAGLQVDDALYAATAGDVAMADRALDLAIGEGASAVSVVRALLAHLQRLERVRLLMRDGLSASEAVRGLRPPVFFRRQAQLAQAAAAWSAEALANAEQAAWAAERDSKRTGMPAMVLCRQTLLTIARHAGRR